MVKGQVYYEIARMLNPRRRRSNRSNHRLLKVVVYHELRDVMESLDKGVCPFCGRRFQGYVVARSHITRSKCSFALKARVEDALRLYRRISSCVRRAGSGYYLRVGDLCTPTFRTKGDLATFIAETGLLAKLKYAF
jgi:hypothetical protein